MRFGVAYDFDHGSAISCDYKYDYKYKEGPLADY